MKIKLLALALFIPFLVAGTLHAQTATHFTVSGTGASFTGATGTSAVAIAGVNVQMTPNFSAGYKHYQIPAINARFEMGVIDYSRSLDKLVGSKIASKFTFDLSKINVTFEGGGGKLLQPTANRIAETGGVFLAYPLSDHVSLQLVGVTVLHGGIQTGFVTVSTTETVGSGLSFSF